MNKTINIGLPCSPSKRLSANTKTVTKVTRATTGGMAGGRVEHFGDILDENDRYITFMDMITGKTYRIGHNYVQLIEDNIEVVMDTVDTTAHANYNGRKVNKRIVKRWFEVPANANTEWTNEVKGYQNKEIDPFHSETVDS